MIEGIIIICLLIVITVFLINIHNSYNKKLIYILKGDPYKQKYYYDKECSIYCYNGSGMQTGVILNTFLNDKIHTIVIPKYKFESDYILNNEVN